MAFPPSSPPVVLIVEDDPVNLSLLTEVCRAEGYEVVAAEDGEAALAAFEARDDVDVVLLDLAMPGMDGLTLCRLLRAQSEVPVVVVTALMEEMARERAMAAGATAFVSKPFRIFELTREVRQALSQRGTASEPPTQHRRWNRRSFASVLNQVGGAMPLRLALRKLLESDDESVVGVIRLENELDVVARAGKMARDAVIGFMARRMLDGLDPQHVYWAESNEIAVLFSPDLLEPMAAAVGRAVVDVSELGVGEVTYRYGAVRFLPGPNLDVDDVLRAARGAVGEAQRRGQSVWVETLRGDSNPPQR